MLSIGSSYDGTPPEHVAIILNDNRLFALVEIGPRYNAVKATEQVRDDTGYFAQRFDCLMLHKLGEYRYFRDWAESIGEFHDPVFHYILEHGDYAIYERLM